MNDASYDRWVFDLDGTLVDVEESYIDDVIGRVGDRIGYQFSDQQVAELWHGFSGERNDRLRAWGIDSDRFWEVFHDEEDPTARAESTFLYPDATVIAEIDAPTVLVTHCQEYLTHPVLEGLDIGDWFDSVVCCTADTGWKPDPKPVRAALTAAGADSGRGILVGDSPQDVGAAWNAGLDAAHVERHGHERRGSCVVGDHRIGRIDKLVRSSVQS